MKYVVVKFKKGHVGYAHNFNEAVESTLFEEATPFGFDKVAGRPDPGIYNVFWELNKVMTLTYDYIKAHPTERVQMAVPGQVWALANNIDMMTRMIWTRKCLYYTVQDEKSRRTLLLNRKTVGANSDYPLSDAEYTMYTHLLTNMKKLMGLMLVRDSQFICRKEENAKTPEQRIWFDLNQACNQLLDIGQGGAKGPWAGIANGVTQAGSAAPALEDEEGELPF